MTTLLQRAATWLGERLQTAAGRTVTYRRGQRVSSDIVGWVSSHDYEEAGDDGLVATVTMDDWSFIAAELLVNGEAITPRPGDQIIEGSVIYEVLPLRNRPCWERADGASGGLLTLIHAKRVGS